MARKRFWLRRANPHDVAILDIRMPKLSGIEVLLHWKRLGKTTPTILLTTFDEDPLFLEAVQAGAHGFLLKDVSLERLAETIRIVSTGKKVLQPVLTERIVRIVQDAGTTFSSTDNPEPLTPRESDILRLIAAGIAIAKLPSAWYERGGGQESCVRGVKQTWRARSHACRLARD